MTHLITPTRGIYLTKSAHALTNHNATCLGRKKRDPPSLPCSEICRQSSHNSKIKGLSFNGFG